MLLLPKVNKGEREASEAMRLPYKAAQLALYGSGDEIYIATASSQNRIVVFDQRAVLTLSWEDKSNSEAMFSIAVSRRAFLSIVRKGRPSSGFYLLRILAAKKHLLLFDLATLAQTSDPAKSVIGAVQFREVDISEINQYYKGLVSDQSIMTGSVSVDFDGFRQVMEFLNSYIAAGRFAGREVRVANFQTVNELQPLLCQAFVKCDGSLVCDLDVSINSFRK